MKLSGLVLSILLIGLVMTSWVFLVNDFETNYIETNISEAEPMNESYKETYNRVDELNDSFSPIQDSINNINDGAGWFDSVADMAVSLPLFVIKLPGIVLSSVDMLYDILENIAKTVGLPPEIVLIGLVGLILFTIFKIVEMWRRYPV